MPTKLCVIAAIFMAAHADDRHFSPKKLVTELIGNNPQTEAARHRVEAAAKRLRVMFACPHTYWVFRCGLPSQIGE